MPWWFWVLLWAVLALTGLAVLAILTLRTGRRALAALEAVSELGEDMTRRWEQGSAAVAHHIRRTPVPGILVPLDQARREYLTGREARRDRLAARRIARRDRRGQPQRVDDLRRGAQKGNNHG
ncbi:Uncharacterised protein [Rothia kristinae]|uniref:hypothetical protein n=1 Tax=Rothia kristinae TaxID=37923 RepID=UPI000773FC74|nr:hypothetical protein [Rothia kristinae]SQC28989.1 Uncharacterised protein [Rothia kristinae]